MNSPTKVILGLASALVVGALGGWLMLPVLEEGIADPGAVDPQRQAREADVAAEIPILNFEEQATRALLGRGAHRESLAIFLQWAEQDPMEMLEWAKSRDDVGATNNAWRAWGAVDLDAAWNHSETDVQRASIVRGAVEDDPVGVIQFFEGEGLSYSSSGEMEWAFRMALENWIQVEPHEALEYALAMEVRGEFFYRSLLGKLGEIDPDAAIAWAGRMSHLELGLEHRVAMGAAANHPLWALAGIDNQTSREADQIREALVPGLAARDLGAALVQARQIENDARRFDALLECLPFCYARDEAEAIALLEEMPLEQLAHYSKGARDTHDVRLHWFLLERLLETDPDRAVSLMGQSVEWGISFVDKLSSVELLRLAGNDASSEVRGEVIARGDDVARDYWEAMPASVNRDHFLWEWARNRLDGGEFEKALQLAELDPSGEVAAGIWKNYTTLQPEAGEALLLVETDEVVRRGILQGLIDSLAVGGRFEEADALLVENPELQEDPDALVSLYYKRVAEDQAEAADWILTLPEGEGRTWSTHRLISHLSDIDNPAYDPEAAMHWITTQVSEPDPETVVSAFELWLDQDEAAARAFAEEAEMDDDLREELQSTP